jgi:hypothetical protein
MAFVAPLFTAVSGALGGSAGIGSLLGGVGTIFSTIGAVGAANYQAQVAKNNAAIAERNAAQASDAAQNEQIQSDQQTAALIGEQEAIQGGSGLALTGASQLRTRRTAQRLGRQDALNIRTSGDNEIGQFLQQAENFRGEARSQKAAATGAMIGGALDFGSSLIGGAKSTKSANRITGGAQIRLRNDLRSARV